MRETLLTKYSCFKDWVKERIRRAPSAPKYYWQLVKNLGKPQRAWRSQAGTSPMRFEHQDASTSYTEVLDESATGVRAFDRVIAGGQDLAAAEQFRQDSAEYRRQYWNRLAQTDYQHAILGESGLTEEEFLDSGLSIVGWLRDYELCDDSSIVLDIGCGAGRIAYHVAPLVRFLYAVDVSDEMVERARKNLSHLNNVEIRQATGESLRDFPDRSIDLVYSILVLQHMERENCYRMFREMARVLRPGGKVLVQLPWSGSQLYVSAYDEEPGDSDLWYGRVYSEGELEGLFLKNGFSVVHVRVIGDDLWGVGTR